MRHQSRWRILTTVIFITFLIGSNWIAAGPKVDVSIEPGAPYCENQWPYQLKVGQFHIHTLLSTPPKFQSGKFRFNLGEYDHAASGDPDAMLATAHRNHFDFLGFSDHAENLTSGGWQFLGDCERRTDGTVALRGCEWTDGGALFNTTNTNHLNIFGSRQPIGTASWRDDWPGVLAENLSVLYQTLNGLDDDWCGAFCHPWVGHSQFDQFRRPSDSARLTDRMAMIEVGGGDNPYHQIDLAYGEKYYRQALANGWRVGPIIGSDNFGANPSTDLVSIVWTESGVDSVAALRAAILARRVSASAYRAPIDLRFAALESHSQWIVAGNRLQIASDGRVTFAIRVSALAKASGLRVYLYGLANDGTVIARHELPPNQSSAWSVHCRPPAKILCYYLRVKFGAHVVALSAPIWVTPAAEYVGPQAPIIPAPVPVLAPVPPRPTPPAVSRPASPSLIMEPRSAMPPWVAPSRLPVDYADYPYARPNWIRVASHATVSLYVSRHADWTQAVRISLGEQPIWLAVFSSDGANRHTVLDNRTNFDLDYWLEVFHQRQDGQWYRTTNNRLVYDDARGGHRLMCEDGSGDDDFDDLVIELRESATSSGGPASQSETETSPLPPRPPRPSHSIGELQRLAEQLQAIPDGRPTLKLTTCASYYIKDQVIEPGPRRTVFTRNALAYAVVHITDAPAGSRLEFVATSYGGRTAISHRCQGASVESIRCRVGTRSAGPIELRVTLIDRQGHRLLTTAQTIQIQP